jgi:hypothetical protein
VRYNRGGAAALFQLRIESSGQLTWAEEAWKFVDQVKRGAADLHYGGGG